MDKLKELWDREEVASYEVWERDGEVDIIPLLPVYEHLSQYADYCPELDAIWQRFASRTAYGSRSEDWEDFLSHLGAIGEVSGLYGEGQPVYQNTYETDSCFSEDFCCTLFTFEGEYEKLESHGLYDGTFALLQYGTAYGPSGPGIIVECEESILGVGSPVLYCENDHIWNWQGWGWDWVGSGQEEKLDKFPAFDNWEELSDLPANTIIVQSRDSMLCPLCHSELKIGG